MPENLSAGFFFVLIFLRLLPIAFAVWVAVTLVRIRRAVEEIAARTPVTGS